MKKMKNTCRKLILALFTTMLFNAPIAVAQKNQIPDQNNKTRYNSLETFARALYYLETMYVDPEKVKPIDTISHALNGIVNNLDPHTILMPPKALEQLTSDTKGKFGGVGIIVSQERNRLIIVSPIEGTPAMKAGVLSGDEIIAIDDVPLSKMKPNQAVDQMRGKPGSILKLTIKRKKHKKPISYDLVREIIKISSVRMQDIANGIYYLRITSFQENTASQVEKLLTENKKNIKGIILDLRDNPGGLLDQSVKIVDLFIESGLIVSTVGRDPDRVEREFAHKQNTFSAFPMITLINGGSASASEIVAGALQDHQRALIMGTTSFGKGSVQTIVSLPNGSALKLTVARYYTPKDRSIQAKGIIPDIIVNKRQVKINSTSKKEADLKGHIAGNNLSDLSVDSGILSSIQTWPQNMQNDYQLVSAFTYLKGWSIFKK